MRHPNLFLLSLLVLLTGCDVISPFIDEDLKVAICDRDNDGLPRSTEYCGGNDCDDTDAAIGQPLGWFRDVDTDTFGAGEETFACTQPEGYVDHNGDCDDTDQLVHPDATEVCNGYDDNCDDNVDDQNIPTWFADTDLDTYGDPAVSLTQCDQPDGYVTDATDCDDSDGLVNPDSTEVCDDGIDQDCNNIVDDSDGAQVWYVDIDGDGWGDEDMFLYSCQESVNGYVLDKTDCNDGDVLVNPAATEVCNDLVDNNCNGKIDTDTVDVPWYRDADEDGWGDESDSVTACAPPTGYVEDATDCNDTDPLVNPDVEEVCNNGVDDNCDDGSLECRFSGPYDLEDSASLAIVGDGGQFGRALAFADFNGDGIDDLAVGGFQDSTNGANAGAVYFFWGPLAQTGELDASLYDARILGDAGSQFGRDIVLLDDLSGDGLNDLAISAIGNSRVYVFFLPILSAEMVATEADVVVSELAAGSCGTMAGNGQGFAIESGDLNTDSFSDLAIGGCDSNKAAVFWGPLAPGSLNLSSAAVIIAGDDNNFGYSLAVGDFSADGIDDLAVGAPEAGGSNWGEVRMYFGPLNAEPTASLVLAGSNNDRYGSQAFTADLNGDTVDDLFASSRQVNSVRITWGGTLNPSSIATATWNPTCGAGADLDGDGIDDLLVAQRQVGGYTCGDGSCVTLVYGSTSTIATAATWYLDAQIPAVGAGAPELTGDTYPDIVIGSASQNKVWLIPGLGI